MLERNPIGNDARRAKRERTLGPDSVCLLCGYSRPEGLRSVPRRRLLEAHHVLGRANDAAFTVLLCRNCHAEITEEYHAHGVSMAPPVSTPACVVASLKAQGIFIEALSHSRTRLAAELQQWLDEDSDDRP